MHKMFKIAILAQLSFIIAYWKNKEYIFGHNPNGGSGGRAPDAGKFFK